MAIIRNLQGTKNPLIKKTPPKGSPQPTKVEAKVFREQKDPSDRVHIQDPVKSAVADQPDCATAQTRSTPLTEPRSEVPSVLTAEASPNASTADEAEEMTNWVLESAASTPYAKDPSMEIVRKRYGTLTKVVRDSLSEPLLDAITTSDTEEGSGKLKELADTANWAQKFKKDALKLVTDGGYEALLEKAQDSKRSGKTEKSLLDGLMEGGSLVFSAELPQHRAKEANQLLQQFQNGNENPGIGSKALGKGISYLRGRKGTRLFYKKQGDKIQWLAVCDKSTEPKAIKRLQKEFGLS
jgi:hypothetical protein